MLTRFQVEKAAAQAGSLESNPRLLPLSMVRMIWKRKLAIGGITLVGCALAVLAVRRMPSTYVAEALVLIDSQRIPEKFVSSTVSTELQDRIATISQQILSSSKLETIIAEFGLYREERKRLLAEDILELMRKDVSIQMDRGWTGGKPGAFRISYQGKDPRLVAQVANRIANLYIEGNYKTREGQAEGTSEFMDRQLAEAKGRLDELEAAVGQFKLKYNGELPEQQSALIATLGRLEVELQTNRDALNRVQESKAMLESNLSATEATLQALAAVADRPEGAAAPAAPGAGIGPGTPQRKPSEVLQAQLDALSSRYGPAHPDVKRLQAGIAALKTAEAAQPVEVALGESSEVRGPASRTADQGAQRMEQPSERLPPLQAQIGSAEREIDFRAQEQRRITAEMQQYAARISRLPLREQQMAQVTRDYEISKANYRNLLDKKLAAEMARDLEHGQKPERFTLLDPARVPEKPQRPNRPLLYALGSLLSTAIGLALGVGLEMKAGKLLGEWELGPQIPILARLPKIVVSRRRFAVAVPR